MVTGSEALASGELIPRIACGYYHSLALKLDGSVYSFGRNDYGQLGLGNNEASRVPLRIEALSTLAIKDVTSGCYHSIALTKTGSVYVCSCSFVLLTVVTSSYFFYFFSCLLSSF